MSYSYAELARLTGNVEKAERALLAAPPGYVGVYTDRLQAARDELTKYQSEYHFEIATKAAQRKSDAARLAETKPTTQAGRRAALNGASAERVKQIDSLVKAAEARAQRSMSKLPGADISKRAKWVRDHETGKVTRVAYEDADARKAALVSEINKVEAKRGAVSDPDIKSSLDRKLSALRAELKGLNK